jgi:alpha-galactosidase
MDIRYMGCLVAVAVGFCWIVLDARAAAVMPEDMQAKNQWVAKHIAKNSPPFTFTYDGKPSVALLANWPNQSETTKLDEQRTRRTHTWTDPKTKLEVRCASVEYSDYPVVEWTVYFRNTGTANTPILQNIQAIDTRWERADGGEFVLHGIKGDFCPSPESYEPYETTLGPNAIVKFTPEGGRPTNRTFPYYNLSMPGGGVIVVVGWPGQWASSFTRDAAKGLQITAGQELTHLYLKPGEEIRSPLMALMFWKGSDVVQSQNVWRRWMTAHNMPRPGGKPIPPSLMMCTSDFYPGMRSTAADEIEYAKTYVNAGVKLDYWWIDAGWYPCGNDWSNTGTWQPDPKRYPNGIKPVADYVHSKGMKLVTWFEPERVTPNSWLAKNHPEWIFGGRNGALLNLGNRDAWKWVVEHIDKLITEQGIDLYRQDFNMDPLNSWRGADSSDRQGIAENLHVQGYLAYWDELRRRHPGMWIDSCASGGRRNDLETLRRAAPLLRSDYRDEAADMQSQTYGLASWVPYYGTGVPNGDNDEYMTRSQWCPWFAIGRNEPRRPGLDWTNYRRMVAEWRAMSIYFSGDYYPLTPHSRSQTAWMAWQFDRPDLGEGMIQAFRHAESPYESIRVKLHGMDPNAVYDIMNLDASTPKQIGGKELSEQGLLIGIDAKRSAIVIKYHKQIKSSVSGG